MNIKRKIVGIIIGMLLISTIFSLTTIAGDEENPEIKDKKWDFIRGLDILSAWFSDDGENLFVSIKLRNMMKTKSNLFGFTVFWTYAGIEYFASKQGEHFYYGYNSNQFLPWRYDDAIGTIDEEKAIISITIPLNDIGSPQAGEKLTSTWAMTHLSGLNFHVPLDRAPDWGTWGKDYTPEF